MERKFNVNFSATAYQALDDLSNRLGIPKADVVREAISLYHWVFNEVSAGNRLLVERGDRVTEMLIPSLERAASEERKPVASEKRQAAVASGAIRR